MAAFAYTIIGLLVVLKIVEKSWESRFTGRTGRPATDLWKASPPRPVEPKKPGFPAGFYIDGNGIIQAGTLGIPTDPASLKILQDRMSRVGKPATPEDFERLPKFILNKASR